MKLRSRGRVSITHRNRSTALEDALEDSQAVVA